MKFGFWIIFLGINFDVAQGECVGLLGANGAGKSTTFKILTGQLQPNIGFAKVDGFDVSTQKSRALEKLGYCPQYDAILKQLSPNEVLQIFARLRGVEATKIDPLVRSLIGKKTRGIIMIKILSRTSWNFRLSRSINFWTFRRNKKKSVGSADDHWRFADDYFGRAKLRTGPEIAEGIEKSDQNAARKRQIGSTFESQHGGVCFSLSKVKFPSSQNT